MQYIVSGIMLIIAKFVSLFNREKGRNLVKIFVIIRESEQDYWFGRDGGVAEIDGDSWLKFTITIFALDFILATCRLPFFDNIRVFAKNNYLLLLLCLLVFIFVIDRMMTRYFSDNKTYFIVFEQEPYLNKIKYTLLFTTITLLIFSLFIYLLL